MLTPKTALMALNELKGTLSNCRMSNQGTTFIAEISVNSSIYRGDGPSKVAAKNVASEKALRDLIINKMSRTPKNEVSILPPTVRDNSEGINWSLLVQ